MVKGFQLFGVGALLVASGLALPQGQAELLKRGAVDNAVAGLKAIVNSAVSGAQAREQALSSLVSIKPVATAQSPAAAYSSLNGIYSTPEPQCVQAGQLAASGLTSFTPASISSKVGSIIGGSVTISGSAHLPALPHPIYPCVPGSLDANYTLPEVTLQGAITIPYGLTGLTPVILVPGIGDIACETFTNTIIPLLKAEAKFDIILLELPYLALKDAQVIAEYIAYTINYVAAVTAKEVAVIAYAEASIWVQWTYKFWASAAAVVSDSIAIGAQFAGYAEFIIEKQISWATEGLLQLQKGSEFLLALELAEAKQALVSTTVILGAAANVTESYLKGAANFAVSGLCAGAVAGEVSTTAALLYNPVTWALTLDALTNPGPAESARVKLNSVCGQYLSPGLALSDMKATLSSVLRYTLAVLSVSNPVKIEPQIASYAKEYFAKLQIKTSWSH